MPIKITGEDRGAGNGPFVVEKTLVNETNIKAIAGYKASTRIILRT